MARVADTSVVAYRSMSWAHLGDAQRRVLEAMVPGQVYSRRDLEKLTGMRTGTVCGRVKELLDAQLLEVHGTKEDPESGVTVEALRLKVGQTELCLS
ncbi:hypothetical protein OU995_21295 [Roseateles sp. SL47]|uniref:hypothetical protein n=1 Tax=Roseateles sp. SL47 TaxID=2995138 RepID=UPI00226DD1A3|nr:hypothetical protein [Roseateles sp. SL47]WAC72082.1 hypothetical protein OU995_21295 [Roseateles sp. SL47]